MTVTGRCAALPLFARRLVALLVMPLLLTAIGFAVYLPVRTAFDAQLQWRVEARQLLVQAAHAPALQASVEQQLAGMRQSALWSKFYATNSGIPAAAALQADVSALAVGVHAGSQILTPLPLQESPLLIRHGVRLSASLRINQLQDLLSAFARHSRFLRVEHLIVVAPQAQLPEENPPLAITLDIHGYSLSDEIAPPAARIAASTAGATR